MTRNILFALLFSLAAPAGAQLNPEDDNIPTVDGVAASEGDTIIAKKINLSKIPPASTFQTMRWSGGKTYTFTEEDVLWLARMVHGETGGRPSYEDADAMLWSLAQRKFFAKGFRKWSMARLVQGYSQPVNPAWLRDGPKCKKFRGTFKTLERGHRCAEHRFKKRGKYINLKWSQLNKVARFAVIGFVQGKSLNPVPGGVGWFAKRTWDKIEKKGNNKKSWEKRVFGWEIERNVFYKSAAKKFGTADWTGGEVVIDSPGT